MEQAEVLKQVGTMASPEGEMDTPLMSGLVTHIVDPSDFWLRIGTGKQLGMELDPVIMTLTAVTWTQIRDCVSVKNLDDLTFMVSPGVL